MRTTLKTILVISLICLLLWLFSCWHRLFIGPPVCNTTYKGILICFPTNVEGAVKKNQLGYKPPGYYYKLLPDSTELVLQYETSFSDFFDEGQPESTLYSRVVDGYVFTSLGGSLASERNRLENQLSLTMAVSKRKSTTRLPASTDRTSDAGIVNLWTGVSEGVRVYLRESLSHDQKPQVEVIFTNSTEPERLNLLTHTM